MHSNPSEQCSACAEKLQGCHNSLKLWHEIIADNFKDCHVAVGFRGEHDQDVALAQHLTHAPWPQSKHNRMENNVASSWALDLFRLGDDGKAYFELAYFQKIWELIDHIQTQAGDREMYWGGLFTNLKDYDHFELLKVEIVQSIEVLSQDSC
jgi:hypothetical protein